MESAENSEQRRRMPLVEVVTDCVTRWFQFTLKEAKAGDIAMQVLVGQMYYSGYGVPRDAQKGRTWIGRAAGRRTSVWKVGNKNPGYNARYQGRCQVGRDVVFVWNAGDNKTNYWIS